VRLRRPDNGRCFRAPRRLSTLRGAPYHRCPWKTRISAGPEMGNSQPALTLVAGTMIAARKVRSAGISSWTRDSTYPGAYLPSLFKVPSGRPSSRLISCRGHPHLPSGFAARYTFKNRSAKSRNCSAEMSGSSRSLANTRNRTSASWIPPKQRYPTVTINEAKSGSGLSPCPSSPP
jgi:hypothetical protein